MVISKVVSGVLLTLLIGAVLLAPRIYAQDTGAQPTVESPLLPTLLPATPQLTPTPTPQPPPTATPTNTATPTPTATATLDLAAAALQVSPLRIAADDRPIAASSALLWIAFAAVMVVAGAGVMVVAQQRENRR